MSVPFLPLRRCIRVSALILFGVMLTACSHGSAGEGVASTGARAADVAASGGGSKGLVFYIEQTGTSDMMEGVNETVKAYKASLQDCQGAAIKPLSSQDEAKLGTVHLKYWHGGDGRTAWWVRRYELAGEITVNPPACNFRLEPKTELEVVRGSRELAAKHLARVYMVDMDRRTGNVQTVPYTPVSHESPMMGLPPEVLSIGAKSSFLGWPCLVVKNKVIDRTSCVWTGGAEFGFSPTAPEEFPKIIGTPTLWGKSDKGGNSFTTVKFMVGKLPNANVFDIPADVKIVDQGGP